ncbi:MAG: TonB-dependent receptor plug domain-containing protein [Akkermansiaceae bacterium]
MTHQKTAFYGLIIAGLSYGSAYGNIKTELEPITVYAKRIASPIEETTSAITILTSEELERMQKSRLINGLNLVPGVQGLSTAGQTGNLGSVLIRGLSTKYMQIVVDGVRLTDATNGASSFLGNSQLSGMTHLEVLRGPQSVLYGSGAAGGVIGYETALGSGENTSVSAEAGNFGTFRSSFLTQGTVGDLSYAVGAGYFETDNDPRGGLRQHGYRQDFETLALEWLAREDLQIRLSYRGSQNELDIISDSGFGASPAAIDTDTNLFALNALYDVNPWWSTRVNLGYYDEAYRADFNGFLLATDYDRASLNWVNQIEMNDQFKIQAGLEYARSDYRNLNGQDIDYRTTGAFVNGVWTPTVDLLIEAGLRYEDHNAFGSDLAWNIGAIYDLGDSRRLRARVAEAYRAPTLIDSQAFNPGFGATQDANPNLEAEQIFGFEVGVEQDFGDQSLGLSYFQQGLENAIARGPVSGGSYQNINLDGTTEVSGVELELNGQLSDEMRYRLAASRQFKEELIDIPDMQVSVDVSYQFEKTSIGFGVTYVDGADYGLANVTDTYTVGRVYGSYELNDSVTLFGRVENLFDEDYLVSDDGFLPISGQGRSFVIGATLEW